MSKSSVAVGVFENDHFVLRLGAGFDVRVDRAGCHPEPAAGVEIDVDRIGDHRLGGEEADLQLRRQGELLALPFGVECLEFQFVRRRLGNGRRKRLVDEQRGDARLGLGDEWVELGDLLGVLPLLVLAKTAQVGLILRPVAMEVEFVFLGDQLPQPRGLFACTERLVRFDPELLQRRLRKGPIAGRVETDRIVSQRRRRRGDHLLHGTEQVDVAQAVLFCKHP
jgi:hypothetical protein